MHLHRWDRYQQWINHSLTPEIQKSPAGINPFCITKSGTHPAIHKLVMQNSQEKLTYVICQKYLERQI